MDQRLTTEADLYERLFPGSPLPSWLGEALRYPVRDIPTLEDYEREQGMIGVPTEEQSSRDVGQGALDYLTMAHGLASLLKGGGSAAQELMGKQRGAETFGKETMDTLRRAQPQRWERMEEENRALRPQAGEELLEGGRESYRQQMMARGGSIGLPPGETPTWRTGESLPPGAVTRGPLTALSRSEGRKVIEDAYHIGTPTALPGGREAQYVVFPIGDNFYIHLKDGERLHYVGATNEIGEALATAQKLQTRLALAGRELAERAETGTLRSLPGRQLRLPWEPRTAPRVFEGSSPSGGWTR